MKETSAAFLYRWHVRKADPNPMYGRDKVLKRFEDKDEAVKYAIAETARGRKDLFVEERRYASERNLERDFCFDSCVVWSEWMNG